MKILVIDDSARHQKAAREQLADHDLTVAGSYAEAVKLLGQQSMRRPDQSEHKFDVVLTDMNLPMNNANLTKEAFRPGELVPYGHLIALLAAKGGADYVGLLTDTNHHDSPISASLDLIDPGVKQQPIKAKPNFRINGAETFFVHAPLEKNNDGELVKDWAEVLWCLTATDAEREKREKELKEELRKQRQNSDGFF